MRRAPRNVDATARPRLPLRDLLGESVAGLLARPARVALTVLGTVVGVAALVATLGLSKTASNQIVGRFDARSDHPRPPEQGPAGVTVFSTAQKEPHPWIR